jgi:hypothetical protein
MREDQRFVWGIDLTAALRSINAHFTQLSEAEREKGIMSFASAPPPGNLVAEMWDRHLRPGDRKDDDIKLTPEAEAALVKKLKAFSEQPTLDRDRAGDEEEAMISIKRMVSKRRGSWWQLPKDLKETGDQD